MPKNTALSDVGGSPERHYGLMLLLALGVVLFNLFFLEHIPLHNGIGFDEVRRYLPIVLTFPDGLLDHSIDTSSVQRCLIYGFMHVVLTTCNIPLTDANIVSAFHVFQSIVFMTCVLMWIGICRRMKLSSASAWLGFVGLFVNYQMMKFIFYRPFLTDCTAVLVALASLYFYISRRLLPLFLVSLLSLMVWPSSLLFQSLLLLIPPEQEMPSTESTKGSTLLGVGAALAWLAICLSLYSHGFTDRQIAPPIWPLVPVGIGLVAAYAFLVSSTIFRGIDFSLSAIRRVLSNVGLTRFICFGVFVGLFVFLTQFVAHKTYSRGMHELIERTVYSGTSRPLVFLVGHFVFLGPFVILIMRYFKEYCATLRSLGFGLMLVVAFAFAEAINAETRHLSNVWPYIVLPCAMMLKGWDRRSVISMLIVSLVVSRFWLPINSFCPPGDASFPGVSINTRFDFPAQAYFMSNGHNMGLTAYVVFLVIFGLLWLCFSREQFKTRTSKATALPEVASQELQPALQSAHSKVEDCGVLR